MDIKITKNNDKYDVLLMTINQGKLCLDIDEINDYINENKLYSSDKELNIYIDKNIKNGEYFKILNVIKNKIRGK